MLKKLFTFFLQGVLICAPILGTIYLVYWLFTAIDNLLPISKILSLFSNTAADGSNHFVLKQYPGMGFLVILLIVLLIGYLSSNFITGRLFRLFENMFEKLPGVKTVYTTIKDFFEAFAGNKRKFTKPVRVLMRKNPALWQIGFVTQEELSKISTPDENLVCVYLPHSYAVSGVTLFVSSEFIVPITNITPANAMKMAISGGVTGYSDEEEESGE